MASETEDVDEVLVELLLAEDAALLCGMDAAISA